MKVFNDYSLCPGFFLQISETKGDTGDSKRYKIDGSLIAEEDFEDTRPKQPNWNLQSLQIEFKRGGEEKEPYNDLTGVDAEEVPRAEREANRGQLMSYADRVFCYQHRTAVYQLFINGPEFRLLRWDRSGVIVSCKRSYIDTIRAPEGLSQDPVPVVTDDARRAGHGPDRGAAEQ